MKTFRVCNEQSLAKKKSTAQICRCAKVRNSSPGKKVTANQNTLTFVHRESLKHPVDPSVNFILDRLLNIYSIVFFHLFSVCLAHDRTSLEDFTN